MDQSKLLRLAVCLFPDVCALDFVGPMELLSSLFPEWLAKTEAGPSPYTIKVAYVSTSKEPVRATSALTISPDQSYEEATEQFDLLLVPGGKKEALTDVAILTFLRQVWGLALVYARSRSSTSSSAKHLVLNTCSLYARVLRCSRMLACCVENARPRTSRSSSASWKKHVSWISPGSPRPDGWSMARYGLLLA